VSSARGPPPVARHRRLDRVVVHVDDGHLSFATFIRYDRSPAALAICDLL
jgi:hypothetical protein